MAIQKYSNTDVAQGIRAHLGINSNDLPSLSTMDSLLWQACAKALKSDSAIRELEWIELGALLSSVIKDASNELIGKLSEKAVCSFIADVSEEDFLLNFGRQEYWQSLAIDARINYFRARFSSIYWCSVRDFAVKSKRDCKSVFHLPNSIIEMLAESTTSQIIDFCHGFPHLQHFKLTCPTKDCLLIAKLLESSDSTHVVCQRIMAAKLIKANHCANFELHSCGVR